MNQRRQQSQETKPKPGLVKILAKNQSPSPPPEPQTDKPMDNYEQLKEAGFSEKQSIVLANVIGSIRKDIEKLTNYVVEHFTAMDTRMDGLETRMDSLGTRMDGLDKKIDELKADMKEGFAASDKKISELKTDMNARFDNLVKVIMWATGIIVVVFLGILGFLM